MRNYKTLNNVLGWAVFLIAAVVYTLTLEPTASFWDCGEYIATSYKLQVGHPPGAPTFQLLGRFFSLFAFGDVTRVAFMINMMSALSSAFTILFLFWTITHLAKKMVGQDMENPAKMWTVLGAGIVGALAYTFSDSFWFSAVEGEVYAMSSMFTALVFWLMLKWEEDADDPRSLRWIVLIAFLMGLSIGVHLLNLLTLPALVMIYYYKRFKVTRKGVFYALTFSIVLLAFLFYILIPRIIWLAGHFELFFINSAGLPFNSGTIIYFALIIGLIIWGIRYTIRKGKVILNTIILSFTFLLIGYSTFFILIIRSNAGTPINENAPKDAISLLSYLNREQYGETPLITGPYFNAGNEREEQSKFKDQSPVYEKDVEQGKYILTDSRENTRPTYKSKYTTFFPRMWSMDNGHINIYLNWAGIDEGKVYQSYIDENGQTKYDRSRAKNPPTFGQNLTFFGTYQLGHMYFRYFFWNFVGRQNDIQGSGGPTEGNWHSGIPFIDNLHNGDQSQVPDHMKSNRGRNAFYFLPLILGLVGLFFHLNRHSRDMLIVTLLFVMTGLAIVVYLNQYPNQPRERDYAYAGSFYAFAIWIGLGVIGLIELIRKGLQKIPGFTKADIVAPFAATLIAVLLVPGIMASEGWDDHDRSDRYTARDFAMNYLASCPPNAILFTNGDNDTFPLWYVQEVEGYRTDVRVINLSLFNTDWYADQMKRAVYDAKPAPISMNHLQYRQGTRDAVELITPTLLSYVQTAIERQNDPNLTPEQSQQLNNILQQYKWILNVDPAIQAMYTKPVSLNVLFDIIHKTPEKLQHPNYKAYNFFPTNTFVIPVDSQKVVSNGTVPAQWRNNVVDSLTWTLPDQFMNKNTLFVLDILAHNNWERPICFATTAGPDAYIGLEDYLSMEGFVYRLVPVKTGNTLINTPVMFDNLMNKFKWGNLAGEGVYLDETNMRMCMTLKYSFINLADALLKEGNRAKAIQVMNKCMEVLPEKSVPWAGIGNSSSGQIMIQMADMYFQTKENKKAEAILSRMTELVSAELNFYGSMSKKQAKQMEKEYQDAVRSLFFLWKTAYQNGDQVPALCQKIEPVFTMYRQAIAELLPAQEKIGVAQLYLKQGKATKDASLKTKGNAYISDALTEVEKTLEYLGTVQVNEQNMEQYSELLRTNLQNLYMIGQITYQLIDDAKLKERVDKVAAKYQKELDLMYGMPKE